MEDSEDREPQSAAVYGVTKNWTGLGDQKTTTKSSIKWRMLTPSVGGSGSIKSSKILLCVLLEIEPGLCPRL